MKHVKQLEREIPRLQTQRQSWCHLRTAAGDEHTVRLVDSRRHWPAMRSGDASTPHHLHGDDERVGGHRHAAQE